MRAKTINEVNFEKNRNPKETLDVGGINFGMQLHEIIQVWKADLEKAILGKTITAIMQPIISNRGQREDRSKETVEVKEVDNIYDTNSSRGGIGLWSLVIEDFNEKRYVIELDQKIWIS